jgi:osmotically-inducible protein OsmY
MNNQFPTRRLTSIAAIAASSVLLVACGPAEDPPPPPPPSQQMGSADPAPTQTAPVEQRGGDATNTGADSPRELGQPTQSQQETMSQSVDDSAITAAVKAKLVGSDNLKDTDISVDTEKGVVVLTGTAPSEVAVANASAVARSVDGVTNVENRIEVAAR